MYSFSIRNLHLEENAILLIGMNAEANWMLICEPEVVRPNRRSEA